MALVTMVVPWAMEAAPLSTPRAAMPVRPPSAGRAGTVGTLADHVRPVASLRATTSVNVPPTSMPTRSRAPAATPAVTASPRSSGMRWPPSSRMGETATMRGGAGEPHGRRIAGPSSARSRGASDAGEPSSACGLAAQRPRGRLHRVHDEVIARTPAERAGQHLPDLVTARRGVLPQEGVGGHDDTGGAVPALQPVARPERLLD